MQRSVRSLILAIVIVVAASTGGAFADEPVRPDFHREPLSANATGGPDGFGYTWDTSAGFNWVDATAGADTGIRGEGPYRTGALDLGFDFRYYENTRRQAWVDKDGYLLLSDPSQYQYGWPRGIPESEAPNDLVAPYWLSTQMAADSRVSYARGGSAPNRYFAVEWYQVHDSHYPENFYTHEIVLWESGDILFQYHTMDVGAGSRGCALVGIEDSRGTDGLEPLGFCPYVQSGTAIRFVRPAPAARVGLQPPHQGGFTRAGGETRFSVSVTNTGELGADTLDINASSAWPLSVYQGDGTTLISDTDGDGVADTGVLAPGATTSLLVVVDAPGEAGIGDSNWAFVQATSSLDPTVSTTATLQAAVPASFVQAYGDNGSHLYLAQPVGQAIRDTESWGSPAVAEAPNGNLVSVSSYYMCRGFGCFSSLEYTILNCYGETILPTRSLTSHTRGATDTSEVNPVVAVASNGNIGIAWVRTIEEDGDPNRANTNVYLAVLDGAGSTVLAPTKVTDNNTWGNYAIDTDVLSYSSPRIVGTDDNRFVLAWSQRYQAPPSATCASNCYVSDIRVSVHASDGSLASLPTDLTNDEPGGSGRANYPALASLTGGRVLLAFERDSNIVFAVLASDGALLRASTNLTNDEDAYMLSPAASQLPNGNIVVAWDSYFDGQIAYAVLGPDYHLLAGPLHLDNPASTTKDGSPSIAPTASGHAVLTWQDRSYRNLYYALLDGSGNVVTRPQIFHTATGSRIAITYAGHANTSYSWQPVEGVDGRVTSSSGLAGSPGGEASIPVRYGSYGQTPLTGAALTMDLPAGLTYVSDDSGLTPLVEALGAASGLVHAAAGGTRITWALPEMSLLDAGTMTVQVSVATDAELGTLYPVSLALTATDDANPDDNQADTQVMAADLTYLPAAFRVGNQ